MLSTFPVGFNFESSPFELTRELLEVMESNAEGYDSKLASYYKVCRLDRLSPSDARRSCLMVQDELSK